MIILSPVLFMIVVMDVLVDRVSCYLLIRQVVAIPVKICDDNDDQSNFVHSFGKMLI